MQRLNLREIVMLQFDHGSTANEHDQTGYVLRRLSKSGFRGCSCRISVCVSVVKLIWFAGRHGDLPLH